MKTVLLFLLFIFSAGLLNGQEIKLKSAVVGSAGSSSQTDKLTISKWRLGEVHLVVLKKEAPDPAHEINWEIRSYPNPFTGFLNLDFRMEEKNDFTIQLTDITGKEQWYFEVKTIYPNEIITLDLTHLVPAIYLVNIVQKDKKIHQLFKVQKL